MEKLGKGMLRFEREDNSLKKGGSLYSRQTDIAQIKANPKASPKNFLNKKKKK